MNNMENKQEEFEVPFGKLSEKVVGEFKLAFPQQYSVSARMMDGYIMMQNWRNIIPQDKQVRVFFSLNYRLHDKNKVITFVQNYSFSEIADRCDKNGMIESCDSLLVNSKKLEVVVGGKYNFGKQASGAEFNGQKFVNKMFQKCADERKWFRPACVVETTKNNNGREVK